MKLASLCSGDALSVTECGSTSVSSGSGLSSALEEGILERTVGKMASGANDGSALETALENPSVSLNGDGIATGEGAVGSWEADTVIDCSSGGTEASNCMGDKLSSGVPSTSAMPIAAMDAELLALRRGSPL